MKKMVLFLFISITAFSFAQQPENQLIQQKKSKQSLNMDFFKADFSEQKENSLTVKLHEVEVQRLKPIDNMPVFSPQGKFFLEIYEVEPNIDEKINIFSLEKSKHFWKTVG